MSTINGLGTLYYGWSHHSDETSHATKWFVVAFFPIIPIRRDHLRVLDPPADAPRRAWQSHFELISRDSLSLGNVLKTYFKAYIIVPIVLLAPVLLVETVRISHPDLLATLELKIGPLNNFVPAVILLYWPIVISIILDRAKGRRKQTKVTSRSR
jgi:hypothetical protein